MHLCLKVSWAMDSLRADSCIQLESWCSTTIAPYSRCNASLRKQHAKPCESYCDGVSNCRLCRSCSIKNSQQNHLLGNSVFAVARAALTKPVCARPSCCPLLCARASLQQRADMSFWRGLGSALRSFGQSIEAAGRGLQGGIAREGREWKRTVAVAFSASLCKRAT